MSAYLKKLQAQERHKTIWEAMNDCQKCKACYINANHKIFVFIQSTDLELIKQKAREFVTNQGVIRACKKHCDQCYEDIDNDPHERQLAGERSQSMDSKNRIMVKNFQEATQRAEQRLREAEQKFE